MFRRFTLSLCIGACLFVRAGSDDWAVAVVEYAPVGPAPGFTNTARALGHAATTTVWDASTPEPVRVFVPPLDVVSIGSGGHLTLMMAAPVVNEDDPVHPFGIDLIAYGNSFFATRTPSENYSSPWLEEYCAEPAEIWVSPDLTNWFRATNSVADALMPAQSVTLDELPSDYLRPIDPGLLQTNWLDGSWSYTNTVTLYAGAAGGAPVDLSQLVDASGSPTSIPSILYVKFVDVSSGLYRSTEIDAVARVAAVPEPVWGFAGLLLFFGISKREARNSKQTGKSEAKERNPAQNQAVSAILISDLRNCFGFRASNFEFPKGGALIFVLIFSASLAACAVLFATLMLTMVMDAELGLSSMALQSGIESATEHAACVVRCDLADGPADSYHDAWVRAPRMTPIADRQAWSAFAASPTNLEGQRVFTLPGPNPGTQIRYRFKLVDSQPAIGATSGVQPLVSAVWRKGAWHATDDINALDARGLDTVLAAFAPQATGDTWRAQALARLMDARDDDHALADPTIADTEAIQFDRVATDADVRWIHLDDMLRLGRYYEERPSHNFFLIAEWHFECDAQTGRSNVVVTLDADPGSDIPGWDQYRDLRAAAGLPRWQPNMWREGRAVAGAGAILGRLTVISNTADSLCLDDSDPRRYESSGAIRQTVTMDNWFSSLNSYTRSDVTACKNRGAFVALRPRVLDAVLLTNLPSREQYRIELYTGARVAEGTRAAATAATDASAPEPAQISFNADGIAVVPGPPVKSIAGAATPMAELLFRAPKEGVSRDTPFFLESAVLRQPACIVLRNVADKPVSIRDWRLGYEYCGQMVWTDPFATSRYCGVNGAPAADPAPSVPARGTLVLTPDASLFDWFAGAHPSGVWGDTRNERTPVVDTGTASWAPVFAVRDARPHREYKKAGPTSAEYPWETEWELSLDLPGAPDTEHPLDTTVVLFDPDGSGDQHAPVPGIVVRQEENRVTVRIAGGRTRFKPATGATLRLCGVPASVRSFWLAMPDGRIAAQVSLPARERTAARTAFTRMVNGEFALTAHSWDAAHSWLRRMPSLDTPAVRNTPCATLADKCATLDSVRIARNDDWFVADSVLLPLSDTGVIREASVRWSRDTATISGNEKGYYSFDGTGLDFPEGAPGLLSAEAHGPSGSLLVRAFRDGGFATLVSPGDPTQSIGSTIVIGPSPNAHGVHLFGDPGTLVAEWPRVPMPSQPVRLTLAGCAARQWQPPHTSVQWRGTTNEPVSVSVSIWHPGTRAFVPLATRAAFDASGRMYLGEATPACFSNGTLRLRIETHDTLLPATAALWLHGIFLHPFSTRHVANVNTMAPRTLSSFCRTDDATTTKLLATPGYPVASVAAFADTLARVGCNTSTDPGMFAVRSDVFDCCIDVEVIKCAGTTSNVLARARKTLKLDRSGARLDPDARVRILSASPLAYGPCKLTERAATVTARNPRHPLPASIEQKRTVSRDEGRTDAQKPERPAPTSRIASSAK